MYNDFLEIKREARRGDYQQVAEMVDCSTELVYKVVAEKRADRRNIKKAFNLLFENRRKMAGKLSPTQNN